MSDERFLPQDLERVFLLPGEYCITEQPKLIGTLLGSCVSVCLYNTRNGSAAMNHFVQARSKGSKHNEGYFGDLSVSLIVERLLTVDGNPRHYEAKVFGGACVLRHLRMAGDIGENNIRIALGTLARYNISVVAQSVGGRNGRKIYFNTSDYSVKVRPISRADGERERGICSPR